MLVFNMRLTAQQKKNLYYLVPLIVLLISTLLFYFLAVRVRPNDKILTNSEGVALFANENPTFEVQFGDRDNPDGQWVRFEAQISNDNPFSSDKKKNIFTEIASIFTPKKKSGIEMSLRGVDFSETKSDGKAQHDEEIQKVADILGTDEIKTSTVLTDMGREIGESEGDQIISKQTIVNQNVADGIDLEYQILKGLGLKEEIVIHDLEAYRNSCDEGCKLPLNEFIFDLKVDEGVVLKKGWFTVEGKSSEVYYFVNGNGKYLAHFLPSYAVDDAGDITYEVDLTINEVKVGNYEAKVTVNSDWLLGENREYPIRIDPSIVHDDSTDFSTGITSGTRYFSDSGLKIIDPSLVGSWNMNETANGTCSGGGDICDQSGNNYNATITGTAAPVTGYEMLGRDFDGVTGTYASLGDQAAFEVQSFTIEAYAKKEGACGPYNYCTIMSKGGSGNQGFGFAIYGGKLHLRINDLGTGGTQYLTGTATLSDNVWYYVAVSVDGTNKTISLYINGNLEATGKYTDTISYSTENVKFGNSNSGNDLSMNGVLDSVRFWRVAKSANDIKNSYLKYGSSVLGTYTSSSLDFGSAASGMTMSWLGSGVNTGNGETPYSTTDMVAQWNFNETSGTTAVSGGTCGTSCNGTLTNMTTTGQDAAAGTGWTANNRRWGAGAVMFDGSNDFVTVTNNSLLNPTTAVTVEGWIKMNTLPTSGGLYEIAGKSSTTAGHALYDLAVYNNSGTIQVYWRMHLSSGLVTYVYQTNYAFVPGTWYYVVGTYDKAQSKMSVYINGVKIGTDMTTLGEDMYSGNNQNLFIGVFDYNGTKSRYFNGIIDSTRIYSRALSANEILSNYQSGNIEFQYRTSTDNSTWSNWTSYNDGALMFDGNDDYVDVGDIAEVDALTSFSTCAWVNNDTMTTDSMIWSKVDNSTWSGIMLVKDIVGQESGRTNMYKIWIGQNSTAALIEGATNSATTGAWQHVCATYTADSATGLRLYINGVEDANSPVSTVGITSIDAGTSVLNIGKYNPGTTSYMDGSIDNIQIYNRVLAGSEIASNYTVFDFETPYSSTGLLANWKFNELDGTTAVSGGACGIACNGTLTNFSSTTNRDSSTTSGWTAKTKLGSDYPEYSFDNPYLYNTDDIGLAAYWPMEEASGSGAYIKNNATPFATGGTVTYSGGYTIHTFTSNGTFVANGSGNVEVLVVGGGGGGGYFGGGGAGGYISQSNFALTRGNKAVTVGSGGAGAWVGNDGSNSVFDTLTASGGGGGGNANVSGRPGGSGGGGVLVGSGTGVSGQGYAGGTGVWVGPSGPYGGGGGGGASQVGATTANNNGGNGGTGIANSITGTSIYYAGGGGGGGSGQLGGLGGSGGNGGGGNGARSEVSHGTAGTNGLGGGGGGGGYFSGVTVGYNGGSGIVIIRYPTSYVAETTDISNGLTATGGTITYVGGYTIHTFTSSGTFVANSAGNVEVLVVAGGGGGGGRHAGGGGGGGVRTSDSLAITSGNYSVTVGTGGAAGPYGGKGGNGGDSIFSTITSTGGGGGGGYTGTAGTVDGASGGSGGGAAGATGLPGGNGVAGSGNTPSTTPVQGYNGGASSAANYAGGGGGGAGAIGSAASGVLGGAGGRGMLSSISGFATYYGGGGGGAGDGNVDGNGGAGGLGGGGRGTGAYNPAQGTAGTANTGGGGGGSRDQAGTLGGSGIVIIRYPSDTIGDLTPTGTASVGGKQGSGRSFNGSSDYLSCSDANCGYNGNLDVMTGSISISAWVKPNTCSTVSVSPGIIDKFDTATSKGYLIYNEYYSGANVWTFYDPVNSSYARSTTPCVVGAWTYITAVYDSSASTKKMYINGKLEATLTGQSPMGDSGSDFNIGRYRNAGLYYNGIIDEVRVFNTPLSASTISSDYISGIANKGSVLSENASSLKLEGIGSTKLMSGEYGVDSNTVGLWHMDERSGTGAYIKDSVPGAALPFATGGTVTYTDSNGLNPRSSPAYAGGYTVHTFTSNGTLTVNASGNVEVLVVGGGGGGGGGNWSGGGGGGDVQYNSSFAVGAGSITATVAAAVGADNNGNSSVFGSITAIGGGKGGYVGQVGGNGATGGGGGAIYPSYGAGGGTGSHGYNGGAGDGHTGTPVGGGGGGHGSAGVNGISADASSKAGNGGSGTSYSISGTLVAYGGGGGGSCHGNVANGTGTDGGGNGVYNATGGAGAANRGGGGGAGSTGGNGGSGIVIVRYPSAYTGGTGGNHGTPTGTTYTNEGKIGGARSFNGTSDYINMGSSINLANKSFTIGAWAKRNTSGVSNYIIGQGATTGTDMTLQFGFRDTNVFTCGFFGDDLNTSATYTDTDWHYWTCTYNSSTKARIIYRDGVVVASGTATANYQGSGTLSIGSGWYNGAIWSGSYFNGAIDEVMISSIDRTANEIAESYKLGKDSYINQTLNTINLSNKNTLGINVASDRPGTYLSTTWGESAFANYQPDANTVGLWHMDEISGSGAYVQSATGNNHGTPTGTTYTSSGKLGGGRSFNGSSDFSVVSRNASLNSTFDGSYTISLWFNSSSTVSIKRMWGMLDASSGYHIAMLNYPSVGKIKFYAGAGTDANALDTTRSNLNDGQWHYAVFQIDGTTQRIYIDGVLDASKTRVAGTASDENFYIGKSNNATTAAEHFAGTMDEVRIDNIARTPDEIRQAYEIGLRTHNITVAFGAGLASGNLITNSGDTSFSIDSTKYGLPSLGSELYAGDKVIVKENYDGTEYIAQGTVTSVNLSTGAVVVSSWDSGSTFPSGGYTVNADVFKWQKEYIPVKNRTISNQVDATNLLTFRLNDGNEGRNIWIDDLRSSTGYLKNSSSEAVTFSSEAQYVQYRSIFSSWDSNVTPYLSQVQIDYTSGDSTPVLEQLMKHGKWFDSSGVKKGFWWVGTH